MQVTFLGHQSWLISKNNTHILIDPVLYDGFGSNDDNAIEIYPPRKIDIDSMPKIDAIILSHEHSDHFHIPTLKKFQNVPIIVSPLFVDCVRNVLIDHHLILKTVPFQSNVEIGELEIILYPAGADTVFWESRVTQILIRPISEPKNSLFIAVDALVSNDFKDDIENEVISIPKVIAVSNNSQITPRGVLGSLDNYKLVNSAGNSPFIGISILKEILNDYLEGIEEIENIIICGGGFTKKYDTFFGSFPFSDQAQLAEIANSLSINRKIFGPTPGQQIAINETMSYAVKPVSWIILDHTRLNEITACGVQFKNNPIEINIKPVSTEMIHFVLSDIQEELNRMATAFMLSEIGNLAINYISSDIANFIPYGFVIIFRKNPQNSNKLIYGLNFNSARFELIDEKYLLLNETTIPFGVELYLNDFLSIINGHIQIWDLGGIGIKSWYVGPSLNSPVAFLYSYYGEQINPKLNYECYSKRWSALQAID